MTTAGGLQRRRVAASTAQDDDDGDAWGLNGATSTTKHSPSLSTSSSHAPSASTSHAGSAFEGGSKIAYDPRDLIEREDEDARQGGKAPRLTIMEEVLLLGLKDKQVCFPLYACLIHVLLSCVRHPFPVSPVSPPSLPIVARTSGLPEPL